MQVKTIRIKNLSCLSFHMSCSQNLFYLYCFFFCFVFFAVFFFFTLGCSTGLALKFHDNLDLVLYTTTTVNNWRFFFTLTRLNFQKRKVNIYDFSATFCFIVVFVSLHQHQLHRRQFTFLKGD